MGFTGVDLFGRGHNEIKYKSIGLNDYRFCIEVENGCAENCFTEKLLDCFATGTVPIYWGCPNVGEFFDTEGILTFSSDDELKNIMQSLSKEKYDSMRGAVENNFELAMKYLQPDDMIYRIILENGYLD